MVHLRERLAKFVRTQRGDTPQRRFARRIGVAQSTIMRIENQEQNVTLDTLEQLCKAFHVDVAGLFAETIERQPTAQYASRANLPAAGMGLAAVHEPTTPDKVGRGKIGPKKAGVRSSQSTGDSIPPKQPGTKSNSKPGKKS